MLPAVSWLAAVQQQFSSNSAGSNLGGSFPKDFTICLKCGNLIRKAQQSILSEAGDRSRGLREEHKPVRGGKRGESRGVKDKVVGRRFCHNRLGCG
jgi:hypothetical protein